MSRCRSLNQARAYWSAKYSGSSRKRSAYARSSGSTRRAMSAVDIIGGVFFAPVFGAGGKRFAAGVLLGRHVRAEVADLRAHVAVQELEPGAGVLVGEVLRVVAEALGVRAQLRVDPQGHVGGRHHRRVVLALDVRVGDQLLRLGVLRL